MTHSSVPVEGLGTAATGTFTFSDSSDIGDMFVCCRSSEEVSRKMLNLSSSDKYSLLKCHFKPQHQFAFLTTYLGGCNHAFCHNWLDDHPWMAYNPKVNGDFCVPCALFSSDHIKG